jgi:hypothetical protein
MIRISPKPFDGRPGAQSAGHAGSSKEIVMSEAVIAAWVSAPPDPRESAGRAKDRELGGQRWGPLPYCASGPHPENRADQSRTDDVMIVQLGGARGAGLERSLLGARCPAGWVVAIPGVDDDEFGLLARECGGLAR